MNKPGEGVNPHDYWEMVMMDGWMMYQINEGCVLPIECYYGRNQ